MNYRGGWGGGLIGVLSLNASAGTMGQMASRVFTSVQNKLIFKYKFMWTSRQGSCFPTNTWLEISQSTLNIYIVTFQTNHRLSKGTLPAGTT